MSSVGASIERDWTTHCAAALRAAVESIMQPGQPGPPRQHPAPEAEAAVDHVARKFGLTTFEQQILILLAGAEAFDVAQRWLTDQTPQPTISWFLDSFADSTWAAFSPQATLRQAQLIHLGPSPWFASSAVRIDEDITHYLLGHPGLAARIDAIRLPAVTPKAAPALDRSTEATVESLAPGPTAVALVGPAGDALGVAVEAASRRQLGSVVIDARALPDDAREVADLAALWNRESVLHDLALILDLSNLSPVEPMWAASQLLHRVHGPVMTLGRPPTELHRPIEEVPITPTGSRSGAPRSLTARAHRLERTIFLDDVVLPAESKARLVRLANRVKNAERVFDEWRFGDRIRGRGISALFAGPSGTGKTMAAEALATELDRDLYAIDLAATVSKYIGETEQNLARIFDAAEDSGAMLLFDEADALFGKRTEVRDSHDRYANLEVSYLLQRIEAFTGVAILTSNIKGALDHAFARRLNVVVDFPLPGATEREEIWRRVLPAEAPIDTLDVRLLAGLSVGGGSITNIAVAAAFEAAAVGGPIAYAHVMQAARHEYAKLGRQLSESEVRGWT